MSENNFHKELHNLIDDYVHKVYDATHNFPRDEQFGVTSQLRRATLSVMLNYVEGFARQRNAVLRNFLEISYGSLKESKYLIEFSYKRKFIDQNLQKDLDNMNNRIGAMLWGTLKNLKS